MRKLLITAVMTVAMVVPGSAALAGPDLDIGNCTGPRGPITTVENNNGTTGYTRVDVCYP